MSIQSSTLRPGLLVSLKTSVVGNVKYIKRTIETDKVTKDGKRVAKWETIRTINDAEEHELACTARATARQAIARVCSQSAFGLLCPDTDVEQLEAAIAEARQVADAFNSKAKLSRIGIYVITGRIAPDDLEAVKAINSEVRSLLDDMSDGLKNLDVKLVRDAASKARQLGTMLSPDAAARIQMAIDAARAKAKEIVAAGEQAALEIDKRTIRTITEARTAFLDLDDAKAVAVPKEQARAVDLTPAKPVKATRAKAAQIEVE